MVATRSPIKNSILLKKISSDFSQFAFIASDNFIWVHTGSEIHYNKARLEDKSFAFSLLHELGHGLLDHSSFTSDVQLLKIERDAWDKAINIAEDYGIDIPHNYIESRMDTYRDWLYARSLCPKCHQCGLQTAKTVYSCPFCSGEWKVSESRLCRVTRRSIKKTPGN